jgi:GNAT superfamily N-acetyltransferase
MSHGLTDAAVSARVRVREIPRGDDLASFVDLAWRINSADPRWVAPLRRNLLTVLDRDRHPFHEHADVAYFVAEEDGVIGGRIAAIVNHRHNQQHGDAVGFFGFFESVDDVDIASALIEAAASWLASRGMRLMRGPMNFSTNEEAASPGVLIEGFDTPPVIQMSHNPPYYAALLEHAGLNKGKDVLAFALQGLDPPERVVRGFERVLQRSRALIRPLDLKRFRGELDAIKQIYNSAWSQNWGFVPMTDAEFEHMAKEFRPVVDPDLCFIAEVEGRPVGFSLALPNVNEALRHVPSGRLFPLGFIKLLWHLRRVRGIRVITLGFEPAYQHTGLGAAFYLRTWQAGTRKGYTRGEASWVLEDNHEMVRALERMGARAYKRYRIFERPLQAADDEVGEELAPERRGR